MAHPSVVGYTTQKPTIDQNNFRLVSFNAVGHNTGDIQQIKISDGGAGTIGWGTENISIWAGVPTIVEGSAYQYCDPANDPEGLAKDYYWGDTDGNKVNFSIAPGQSVVIECSEGLDITVAGQVPTSAVEFITIDQNNFTGNPFPATIDIQNIKISDGGLGTIGWGTENFSIWEGVPTVVDGSAYQYCDPANDPEGLAEDYYWGDTNGNKVTYPIVSGQGVVIECAANLTVTITPPYSL